ncbi:MAG: Asp-tRNA(Asn)/Glu-tRNA(Gln) amidotransferase subunit GatC [Candidatus Howiella sp.]|jgi:aspartyl-tRNA(Asn)/glutamyl-tRNA(Gln) amidotransferase subunit C
MFDVKQTAHLAELSKLNFTEEELTRITGEMDEIVALMDTVADFSAEGEGFVNDAVAFADLRKDEVQSSFPREEILQNGRENNGTAFIVPKVV